MGAFNMVFIQSYVGGPSELVPLGFFLFLAYLFIRLLECFPSRTLLTVLLIFTVALYAYLKQYTVLEFVTRLPSPYLMVGLSYIFFRVVHVMVDTCHQELPCGISALNLFNYCCSFLTFSTGPIARVETFPRNEQLGSLSVSQDSAKDAFSRIANGYIKVIFVSGLMDLYHSRCVEWMTQFQSSKILWVAYGLACLTYLLYLYFNFSGYIDVVIGLGRLFGITLPENFDHPLAAKNFLELWSRWHITLSEWFKVYIFNPLLKGLVTRWGASANRVPYLGVLAYLVTFMLMGIWHGSTPAFIVYGFALGIGVSVNKLYEILMRQKMGKKGFGDLRRKLLYTMFARAIMLSYFAVALTCLWMDFGTLQHWAHKIGIGGVLAVLALCTLILMLLQTVWMLIKKPVYTCHNTLSSWSESFVAQQLWLGIRVFFRIFA